MLIGRSHRRGLATLVRAVAVAVVLVLPAAPVKAQTAEQGQGQRPEGFIVVLKDGSGAQPAAVAIEHSRRFGGQVTFVYEHAIRGYAATFAPGVVGAIAADSRVAYVERDGLMEASTTQGGATWGLDRIDQRNLPLSDTYTSTNDGAPVTAYIIDTGIRFSHAEFGGRAVSGYDAVDGGSADDCNGHGTHVAGTVGGTTYGVAKGVSLVAVRVLNCAGSGTTSGVIAGVDWVTTNHVTPAVANMSLGGGASDALDTAVKNSIAAGVSYAIAAGNGNKGGVAQDACKYSPARVAEAMTIGATDKTDGKTSWSNYGNCVDWFAPGSGITSAWYTSNTATNTISGTSMATPHTAGAAALYLQSNPGASPQQVRDALFANATKGIVTSSKTATNHLLFTNN
jgi:subtilisin family serine protease